MQQLDDIAGGTLGIFLTKSGHKCAAQSDRWKHQNKAFAFGCGISAVGYLFLAAEITGIVALGTFTAKEIINAMNKDKDKNNNKADKDKNHDDSSTSVTTNQSSNISNLN